MDNVLVAYAAAVVIAIAIASFYIGSRAQLKEQRRTTTIGCETLTKVVQLHTRVCPNCKQLGKKR